MDNHKSSGSEKTMVKGTDRAFPQGGNDGIDLRTWIATQAFAAYTTNTQFSMCSLADKAKASVQAADVLIEELNKRIELEDHA